jgi:hypothetical protein
MEDGGMRMPANNPLAGTIGLHSTIETACGRSFDLNHYQEMLTACCDHQWVAAIQKGLSEDSEYLEMLRTEGGAGLSLQKMAEGVKHDNEFVEKLKVMLKEDRCVSLSLCALQDSYLSIRNRRDKQETVAVAAGKKDAATSMKQQRLAFGQVPQR